MAKTSPSRRMRATLENALGNATVSGWRRSGLSGNRPTGESRHSPPAGTARHDRAEFAGAPKRFEFPAPADSVTIQGSKTFGTAEREIGNVTAKRYLEVRYGAPDTHGLRAGRGRRPGRMLATPDGDRLVADALSEGGDVHATESDPDLVREALPFGLETFEGLARSAPDKASLRVGLARGFALYAYLLQDQAERIDEQDLGAARALRTRALAFFLRARDYALEALDRRWPRFRGSLRRDPAAALAVTDARDAEALYWAGAAWAAAIGLRKDNLDRLVELPIAAAHEFFVAYEGGRPGGDRTAAREHNRRAVGLSGGNRAGPHLVLAEAIALPAQDRAASV